MKNRNPWLALLMCCLLASCNSEPPASTVINLIPAPVSMELGTGLFEITDKTTIQLDTDNEEVFSVGNFFNELFQSVSGDLLDIEPITTGSTNFISLELSETIEAEEGYRLKVNEQGISIQARNAVGLFYGVQTLRQLLPVAIDAGTRQSGVRWTVPSVDIEDEPRFGWRGLHLDVSRHFFPKEFIKKYLDYMVRYKLNKFHWHLVDGPGWRIQIDQYPRLTEIGAWRVDKRKEAWSWQATEIGKPTDGRSSYGGYYTKDDIREIINYAEDRFIEVIPEIEMPGHSYAALAAYPELICVNNDIIGNIQFGTDAFCAGNEQSYEFLENVLDEVIELFPSKLVHIGGDEVVKTAWHNCPRCQGLMDKEGLKDEEELQSHFISRMANYIESKGKEVIGWDEILEGGLAENAKVMSWRGMEG